MSEKQASYLPINPDEPGARRRLALVLGVFSLDQLLQLAAMVAEVAEAFGFGQVFVEIENGHPRRLGVGNMTTDLPRTLTPDQAEEALRRAEKGKKP